MKKKLFADAGNGGEDFYSSSISRAERNRSVVSVEKALETEGSLPEEVRESGIWLESGDSISGGSMFTPVGIETGVSATPAVMAVLSADETVFAGSAGNFTAGLWDAAGTAAGEAEWGGIAGGIMYVASQPAAVEVPETPADSEESETPITDPEEIVIPPVDTEDGAAEEPVVSSGGLVTSPADTDGAAEEPVISSGGLVTFPSDSEDTPAEEPVISSGGPVTSTPDTDGAAEEPVISSGGIVTLPADLAGDEITADASSNIVPNVSSAWFLANSSADFVDTRPGAGPNDLYGILASGTPYTNIIYGGGSRGNVSGKITLDVETGAVLSNYLFGAGYFYDAYWTEINLSSGAFVSGYVFGGGRNATVSSGATVNAANEAYNNIFGGGYAAGAAGYSNVTSSVVNISSGFVARYSDVYIFGGGQANGTGAQSTVGQATINITGGTLAYLQGGGWTNYGIVSVGTVNINVSNAVFTRHLYGGGRAQDSGTSTVSVVNLNISGGVFSYIYGGGVGKTGGDSTVGTVNITVTGGTFNANMYGGGRYITGGVASQSIVSGNVSITIDVSSNVVSFGSGSGIYTGGSNLAIVRGNTTLTLTGDGNNLRTGSGKFQGPLNAAAGGTVASNTHTLVFAGFADDNFQAQVTGFNQASFSGNSAVNMTVANSWVSGTGYRFNLSGRGETLSGTAFLQQESGSLGITSASKFNINLGASDLYATSGSFLLMDGMDGAVWTFGSSSVQLTYNGTSGTGTFGGNAIQLGGVSFSLLYNSVNGQFSLAWSQPGTQDEFTALERTQRGILA